MLTGSCLCGTVSYEINGTPQAMYHCHCGVCRKASGASAATNMIVPAASFTVVKGRHSLSSFESSPNKRRYFCSVCGSPIYSHDHKSIDIVSVRCGSLDGDPGVRPMLHIFVESKAPWTTITDGLPQVAGAAS